MKRLRLNWVVYMLVVILAVALAGCNTSESQEGAAATPDNEQGEATPKPEDTEDKVLTVALNKDIKSFDVQDYGFAALDVVHVNMYNLLVKNDANQEKVADLATAWEQVDEVTWRFELRNDVTFHNGDPFTAADVKYTFERAALDPQNKNHSNFKMIKEVNVISDYEVEIVTHYADPVFLNRISKVGSYIMPAKYIEEQGWEYYLSNPVGTGPYKYESWVKDDRVVMVKNEDYFGDEPKWDQIVMRSIPDASTRVSELLTGGVDIAINIAASDIDRVNGNDSTGIVFSPSQRVMQLWVRTTEGVATSDPLVREAIDYAIDDQQLVDILHNGAGTPTQGVTGPGNLGFNETLYNKYNYDPEHAKELLAQAGYADGFELTLTASNGLYPKDKETAEVIAVFLGEVGINVKLDVKDNTQFGQTLSKREMKELLLVGITNSMFDASDSIRKRFTTETAKGETDFSNEEFDALMQASEFNVNEEEREAQIRRSQEILAEERPLIALFQVKNIIGVSERITFQPRTDENFVADEIVLKK